MAPQQAVQPVAGPPDNRPRDSRELRFLRLPHVKSMTGNRVLRIETRPLEAMDIIRSLICGLVTVVTDDDKARLRITVAITDAGDWSAIQRQWLIGDPFRCAEARD